MGFGLIDILDLRIEVTELGVIQRPDPVRNTKNEGPEERMERDRVKV